MLQGSFSHCAADPRFSAMLQESSTASAETSQLPSADSAHGSTPPSSDNTHSVNGAVDVSPVDEGAAAAGFAAVVAAAAVATVAAAVDGHVGGSEKESPVASGGNLLQCFSISSSKVSKGGEQNLQLSKMLPGDSNLSSDTGKQGARGGSGGKGEVGAFPSFVCSNQMRAKLAVSALHLSRPSGSVVESQYCGEDTRSGQRCS